VNPPTLSWPIQFLLAATLLTLNLQPALAADWQAVSAARGADPLARYVDQPRANQNVAINDDLRVRAWSVETTVPDRVAPTPAVPCVDMLCGSDAANVMVAVLCLIPLAILLFAALVLIRLTRWLSRPAARG
jgi:hypothetical protein